MNNVWNSTFRYYILTFVIILLVGTIWVSRDMLTPLIVAGLIAFVLNPSVNLLTKKTRMPRTLSITIVIIVVLVLLIGLPSLLVPRLVAEFELFYADIETITTEVQTFLSTPLNIAGTEISFDALVPDLTSRLTDWITTIPENAIHFVEATTKNIIYGLIIFVSIYYLLKDWTKLRNWVYSLIPEAYQPELRHLYVENRLLWRGYLRGNLTLMLIVAIAFTIAWTIIGLPAALLLGLLTGVLTIIPDLGPAIAAILAVLVALIEGSNTLDISNLWFAVLVTVIYLVLVNIKGFWIRPIVFARSVHMHDGIVFIAIMAAVVLQGILGAIIIVPVLATTGLVGGYIYRKIVGLEPWPEKESEKK